ncbi:hypothetical protein RFI_35524, partial [Reticulomyxa filosa]
ELDVHSDHLPITFNKVESWTKYVVGAGEATIGIKIIWKGNKPWWMIVYVDYEREFKNQRTDFVNNEKHYEMIEDDIRFKVVISKPLELNDDFEAS